MKLDLTSFGVDSKNLDGPDPKSRKQSKLVAFARDGSQISVSKVKRE